MEGKGNSKYCYDDGVLINNKNLHDRNLLEQFERGITTLRISQIKLRRVKFNNLFSIDDYLNLHKYLFGDIYPFAGEIRDEAINKSNKPYYDGKTSFCYPEFIYSNLVRYLRNMKDNICMVNDRRMLVKYLGYYYGEINMIHPFREGNGRTLRTFLELVVDYISENNGLGLELQYSLWNEEDRDNFLRGSVICNVTANTDLLEKCFDKALRYKKRDKVR